MFQILVVDDDKNTRLLLKAVLQAENYHVFTAEDGIQALQIMDREHVALVVLDIMMPKMDGITMTMRLREKHDFPVIMLTAKSEEIDKITGLNIGADDYVTKPFAPMELMARVNSQLRRYRKYREVLEGKVEAKRENILVVGGLELDEEKASVTLDGNPVKLTPLEFKVLALLMKYPGRVFSADELYERVWNEKAITTDTVMVHIRKIREKIERDPKNPQYLKVVWGVGYKIEA